MNQEKIGSSIAHRYVPKFSDVLRAAHTGRTRYMRCPKCHEVS